MNSKKIATELLGELRWLSDRKQVLDAWMGNKSTTSIDADEFFCILFDDLQIEQADMIYELSDTHRARIKEIVGLLNSALSRQPSHIDPRSITCDLDFEMAQKIASTL
jgi:hypothetical protein